MEVTQRTFNLSDRVWYVVSSDEGAVTFFTQSRYMTFGPVREVGGKKVMAGDLGYHFPEGKSRDARHVNGCEFVTTESCRYEGFQSGGMLDVLADEGPDALFAKLTDIHTSTFSKES